MIQDTENSYNPLIDWEEKPKPLPARASIVGSSPDQRKSSYSNSYIRHSIVTTNTFESPTKVYKEEYKK
jgi:hypothetical protein